jgi:UDP-glucose-4-epimerase GalE
VTAVVHFAAHKSVGESMERPGIYWSNNVQGTVHLVEGMLRAGVHRLVFSSSAAVYGNPVRVPITEDSPIRPENVYAESKAMMERVIAWYGVTSGLRSVSLRYFNAAGASSDGVIGEDWSVTTNLVPLVMKAVLGASGPVRVFGDDYPTPDGTGVRDYIHVEDLASAHVAALVHLERGGDDLAVNLGTGVGSSVREILDATSAVAGRPVPHEIVGRRLGDPAVVYADAALAAERLGWRAERTLADIIASAFAWHSSLI